MIDIAGAFGQGIVGPYLVSFFVDKIRHSNLPLTKWLKPESTTAVIRFIRAGTALLNTAGIMFAWDPAGVITISGVTLDNGVGASLILLQNYALQDAFDAKFMIRRATGESTLVAATAIEAKKGDVDVVAVDTKGKVAAAQEAEKQ
jgi:hypothetical protein